MVSAVVACLITMCGTYASAASAGIGVVEGLTCEYLMNPLCVETGSPRFGWRMTVNDRSLPSQIQTAYQILVASDEVIPNSRATVVLPARSVSDVVSADGGKLPDFIRSGNGMVKATVGSGTYRIKISDAAPCGSRGSGFPGALQYYSYIGSLMP